MSAGERHEQRAGDERDVGRVSGSGRAARPVERVRKRNRHEVPYDRERIRDAVLRAQAAVGEDDPQFAEEVADIVGLALAARYAPPEAIAPTGAEADSPAAIPLRDPGLRAPEVEEIQDLVERALIELGRAAVAKAYILYRDRRRRAREALVVHADPTAPRAEGRPRPPLVRELGGTSPWNQARIVSALMAEAELPRELAEEVAERVEGRLCDAGLRRVSTTLIRGFVDNELLSMGFDAAHLRQGPIAVARHDLRALFARPRRRGRTAGDGARTGFAAAAAGTATGPPAGPLAGSGGTDPGGVEGDVAREVIGRWVLEDVLGEDAARLHGGGEIFVEDLGRPHQVLVRSVPAELCLRGEPSPHAPFEMLAELAPLLSGCARGLVLEDLQRVVAPMLRGRATTARAGAARAGLEDLLRALGAMAAAAGRRVDLSAPGGRGGALVARLVGAMASIESETPAPGMFLTWEELAPALQADPGLADAAEALLRAGRLVPVWSAPDERWVAPGCRRRPRERVALACGAAVALNLPRYARRAGSWREDVMLVEVARMVGAAVDALSRLEAFQRDTASARAEAVRERVGYALVPVGLREALRILGDGEVRPDQGARLLGLVAEAASRFAGEHGPTIVLSPFFAERAAEHFARADLAVARASQPRLFADLPAPEQQREGRYSVGYGAACPAGAGHADLLATVRSGALFPLPAVGRAAGATLEAGAPDTLALGALPIGTARDHDHPGLEAWEQFAGERLREPVERLPHARTRRGPAAPLFDVAR